MPDHHSIHMVPDHHLIHMGRDRGILMQMIQGLINNLSDLVNWNIEVDYSETYDRMESHFGPDQSILLNRGGPPRIKLTIEFLARNEIRISGSGVDLPGLNRPPVDEPDR